MNVGKWVKRLNLEKRGHLKFGFLVHEPYKKHKYKKYPVLTLNFLIKALTFANSFEVKMVKSQLHNLIPLLLYINRFFYRIFYFSREKISFFFGIFFFLRFPKFYYIIYAKRKKINARFF